MNNQYSFKIKRRSKYTNKPMLIGVFNYDGIELGQFEKSRLSGRWFYFETYNKGTN